MPLFPVALLLSSESFKGTSVRCLNVQEDHISFVNILASTRNPVCAMLDNWSVLVYGTSNLTIFLDDMRISHNFYQIVTLPDGRKLVADANKYEIAGTVTSDGILQDKTKQFRYSYLKFTSHWEAPYEKTTELSSSLELTAMQYNPDKVYNLRVSRNNTFWQDKHIVLPPNVLSYYGAPNPNIFPLTIQFPKQMLWIKATAKQGIVAPECCSLAVIKVTEPNATVVLPKKMFRIRNAEYLTESGQLKVTAVSSDVLVDMSQYIKLDYFDIAVRSCIDDQANLLLPAARGNLSCDFMPRVINVDGRGQTYKENISLVGKIGLKAKFYPEKLKINLRGICRRFCLEIRGGNSDSSVNVVIDPSCNFNALSLYVSTNLKVKVLNPANIPVEVCIEDRR